MKIAFFDTHGFEKPVFEQENLYFCYQIDYFDVRLTSATAFLTKGYDTVCAFVNDRLDQETLKNLSLNGVKLIALRSAGFNHVDLLAAKSLGIRVVRVPEYSPYAVAEHAVALILTLNRKTHRAYNRIKELNFSLNGLTGFDLHGKTVGIVGTGRIGSVMAKIMHGFGCEVIAYDVCKDPGLGLQYVTFQDLLRRSDIISLHVPLTPDTHHLVDQEALSLTKPGVMLINTGRGALIDTGAMIKALKSGHIGYAGLDVYEEEEGVFFEDLSGQVLQDDVLARLTTFPNVLLTSHQAFLTNEALSAIAKTTLANIAEFVEGKPLTNLVEIK